MGLPKTNGEVFCKKKKPSVFILGLIMEEFGGYKEDSRINSLNLLGREALGLSMCANCATNARNVK